MFLPKMRLILMLISFLGESDAFFFFSSRRRHTRFDCDWSSDVCSSDLSLMSEKEAFAPRRRYSEGVYSSSKWPPNQPMCMHHELSYTLDFPGLMLFACLVAPADAGATPVADSPTVLRELPAELVERFERVGWLLVRNYNDEIGASVAEAFGTDDRGAEIGRASCRERV